MPPQNPPSLAGKKVLVMGLGRFGGGIGVSQWLAAQNALVTVTDMAPAADLADSLQKLAGLPIIFKLGGHDAADFTAADLVVISPAVDKAKSTYVQAAIQNGVPTTTEINLFLERCPALTVGITGSVGKSTTTALIFEALKAALKTPQDSDLKTQESPAVFLGGNIGKSLLLDLPNIRPHGIVILELSSFMLDETAAIHWSPNIAVVTNIFPNHLDRHGTMAAYTAAKQNILRFQTPADTAVLNNDHDLVSRWAHLARGTVLKFTTRGPASKKLRLAMPGDHNQSNAAAALAVLGALASRGIALNRPAAIAAMEKFPGLDHRLQWVHTWTLENIGGTPMPRQIKFYNDSKATTPDASLTAIDAFPPRTALFIVGGYDKQIDLSAFEQLLAQKAAAVLGIGQTGPAIVDRVRAASNAGILAASAPRIQFAGTLERAVAIARQWAGEMPQLQSIVLSPASASYDQFANYEKRGEQFALLSQKTA